MAWDELVSALSSPLVVSAVTSLLVALAVLGLDKLFLQPRADKRRYELSELEKRLDAYGELVALLKATKAKAEAVWSSRKARPKRFSHFLEQHDIKAFDELFGERARLMSPKLVGLWIRRLGEDYKQVMDQKRRAPLSVEGVGSDGLFLDLREMEPIAGSEHRRLTEDWERLAGIKLNL
jgi:hypothetical protein